MLGTVVHTFNPKTQDAETGRSPHLLDQVSLHRELQARYGYSASPFLRKEGGKERQDRMLITVHMEQQGVSPQL